MKRILDNIFAVFVVIIVLALIIPLNTIGGGVVLDFLLILSIALSLIVMLITLYMSEPLDFSIFPTVLLVLTMFRLTLNVSTTRGILATGYAGHVIETFGQFVMGGDPVVGFVMFIIIVLVNFLVITKGAERVSEVAARFTLDAMPGKQMAIDADLGAGAITDEEAKVRRRKIQQEADFYGAMDGATKFVKGDATMSIVTALINLIGGVIIGMVRGSGDFNSVLMSYSLATIGDGLCSQIPALLTSFATGMIVTRAGAQGSFNADVKRQLTQNPTALIIAGVTVLLFMLIPGFPKPVMLIIGAFLVWLGLSLRRSMVREETRAKAAAEQAAAVAAAAEEGLTPTGPGVDEYYRDIDNVFKLLPVDQIEMEFGYSLLHLVDEKSGGNFIERLVLFRKDFAISMGMVFPSVRMRNNPDINPNQYIIKIKGEEVARAEILADHFLALDSGEVTSPVDGIDTVEPAFGIPARWISEDKKVAADVAGYTLIDPVSVMITHLSEVIKKHCWEVLTRVDVKTMVDNIKTTNPTIVEDLIPATVTIGYLLRILQSLLKESVPIRDMETILETLSENQSSLRDIDMTVEYVRQSLKRTITRRFAEANSIRVLVLDPKIEDVIVGGIKRTDKGTTFIPDPAMAGQIITRTQEEIDKVKDVLPTVTVLTSPVVRLYYKRLLDQYIPDITVLSYNEVESGVQIQAIGNITL
ncbi:flagellar biosynthesis protein FlhA [Clostridia bacterium]|nr:flagellar biosynthesis protein FlhA [Clostridia bacterium]